MILEKGKYITVISHGQGIHYLRGPQMKRLTDAAQHGKMEAIEANKRKSPRAPAVKVSILRIVETYESIK